jgi:hypothetical protein
MFDEVVTKDAVGTVLLKFSRTVVSSFFVP